MYVPTVLKVNENDCPVASRPLSHTLESLVDVWLGPSWFVHCTVVPTFIVRFCGWNEKDWIFTLALLGGHVGVGVRVMVGVFVKLGVRVAVGAQPPITFTVPVIDGCIEQ